jgi:hypothetical protein
MKKKQKKGEASGTLVTKQPQDKTKYPLFNRFLICIILYESQVHCHCTIDEKKAKERGGSGMLVTKQPQDS